MPLGSHLSLVHPARAHRQRRSPESTLSCARESFTVAGDATVALFLAGEIDMSTDAHVRDALAQLLDHRGTNIIVDLTGVDFCGISGFVMLVEAARAADTDGRRFAVVARSAQLTRVCALLWPDRQISRHRSFAGAIAEISASQCDRTSSGSSGRPGSQRREAGA